MKHTRKAILIILSLLIAPRLFAESNAAAAWFQNEPRARAYAAVKPDVLHVFDQADGAGLPVSPLMDKLKEGASKQVAGSLLLSAIRAEFERLSTGQSILQRQAVRFSSASDRENALRAISLMLVSGISAQTAQSLFALAPDAGRDPADVVEALNVLTQVKLSSSQEEDAMGALGAAILKSRMPRAAFKSIPSFILTARARGISDEAVDRLIVDVLDSGGTLIQMEAELQKQTRGATSSPEKTATSPSGAQTHSGSSSAAPASGAGVPNKGQPDHRKQP